MERQAVHPASFSSVATSAAALPYLLDPNTRRLVEFFESKGIAALKDEDQRETWYTDWLAYQSQHQLYASMLSPAQYSSLGTHFDLLRYARFLEVFAYFSPAHGYSLQVSFLGLFSILMGSNEALKKEAVAALEAGGLLAFGVSEKGHGSDLLGNDFLVRKAGPDHYLASGAKYYIGNSNSASIISILARADEGAAASKRAPFMFFALRPKDSPAFRDLRKIRTLGVRAAYVGEFDVKDHLFPKADIICQGRQAWDAIFGTVTLGKFFLGFGSIGMCEHAMLEAVSHLTARQLYGKPALEMPHLQSLMTQAFARLAAMKLYAYRALDYVQAAGTKDRRYVLFAAVQKARVSTEGVKVVNLMSECMGAKGLEADTFFEMALRDAQLIPGLEGSMHINLGLAAKFIPRYFSRPDSTLPDPPSLTLQTGPIPENPYLMEARTGSLNTIAFPDFQSAYQPLLSIPNVRTFVKQVKAFRLFALAARSTRVPVSDMDLALPLGQCMASIAYGQLIAESASRLSIAPQLTSVIFHLLINDFSASALALASSPKLGLVSRVMIRRLIAIPATPAADWSFVASRMTAFPSSDPIPNPAAFQ